MIWNTSKQSSSHLSHAKAIFVVNYCQFCRSSILGLKWIFVACADVVGGTIEQSCLFTDLVLLYQWYKKLLNCMHHTSAMPQPFLKLMPANLAQAWFLGWKWSLWPVPVLLVIQQNKALCFLTLYDSINDMKHFQIVFITPKPCQSHFCNWLRPIWRKVHSWAEMEILVWADLVGGTRELNFPFAELIW